MSRGGFTRRSVSASLRRACAPRRSASNTPLRAAALAVEHLVAGGKFDEAASSLEALHRDHPNAKIEAEIVLARYARRAEKTDTAAAARMRELNVALYPESFSAHTAAARTYLAA